MKKRDRLRKGRRSTILTTPELEDVVRIKDDYTR